MKIISVFTYTRIFTGALCVFLSAIISEAYGQNNQNRQLYQIRIFHFDSSEQGKSLHKYLNEAYLPALHRNGISEIGVFEPVGQDTTTDPRVYVFVPFSSFSEFSTLPDKLSNDRQYQQNGKAYINAAYDEPVYNYFETILLRAFPMAPQVQKSQLSGPKDEHIYELRSYGSATEALHRNKVEMFNEGSEIDLFSKLNFNAIFYGSVLAGSNMPNLMYMISFSDMGSRDQHWKEFGNHPEWKAMSSMDKYQNNLSRINSQLLHPTSYSDL